MIGKKVKIESNKYYTTSHYIITKWDVRFMRLADLEIAQWSKDRSSKVGAVIVKDREVISTGYNGFPRGCDDDLEARHERPEKYNWTIHAEPNAIINAARQGKSTLDCDMYLNWFPCEQCAGFIIQAGIKRLYCDKEPDFNDKKWGAGFIKAIEKLKEGGVEVIYMDYDAHRQGNI